MLNVRAELKNYQHEQYYFRLRLGFTAFVVVGLFSLLAMRFFYLQVTQYEHYQTLAENNRISLVPIIPNRGLILDKNGVVLAHNFFVYTLEITPARVKNLEETITEISQLVEISSLDRKRFNKFREQSHSFESAPIRTHLNEAEAARFAVNHYRFPGVEIKSRLFRHYPLGKLGSHMVGYIARINEKDLLNLEKSGDLSNYKGSDHIGKSGLEQFYEKNLHGSTGVQQVEINSDGHAVRVLSSNAPVPGDNLILSVDSKLQEIAETAFGDKRGALVAINPKTGEVLSYVSQPTFDVNLFVDGIDTQSWAALNDDPNKPMLNRPLRGTYPPGSTYKPFMAMAALETGARTPEFTIFDPGYFALGSHRFRDSKPSGHGTVDLKKSIVVSSDTYYYKTAYEMGVDAIHDYMKPLGFGQITGIDLENEVTGILPSTAWKMKRYKQKWLPGETPSIGIGQGYNSFTILQLAHATGILANAGTVMKPHLVRYVEDPVTRMQTPTAKETHRINFRPEYLELVKSAMVEVNRVGTGRVAFAGAEYVAAGKTGTAQVIGIKQGERYDAKKIEERFRDHSLFMSFAPVDNPRLAVAVIVENGGFGAQAAAPIVRKVFDYFLLGKLPKDQAPIVLPRAVDDADLRDVPESMEPEPISAAEAVRQ